MKKLLMLLLLFALGGEAQVLAPPDCVVPFQFVNVSAGPAFNNRTSACTFWEVSYSSTGFTAVTLQFDSASDSSGAAGVWGAFSGTLVSGANPMTSTTNITSIFSGLNPWIRVEVTAVTGSGTIWGLARGYRQPTVTVTVQGQSGGTNLPVSQATASALNAQAVGPIASGAAVSGNPQARMTGNDSVNVQDVRVVSAANLGQTTNSGEVLTEKGTRWVVNSAPAVSNLASASKAAGGVGVRHVADCIGFSAGSTTAPVLTQLNVNLRDGASGAGTVLKSYVVVASASTGQNVAPFSICGLALTGTANTAMTVEFSALLTNLSENVWISGFDVQ